MTTVSADDRKQLRMVACGGCGAKVFIPGDLQPLASTPCPKCGYQIMMPMKLRQFELRAFIASGGMATVYRAFDTVLEREVALKVMKSELASDPDASANFYREARVCASFNHTNIIHIYTFDESDGRKYLVMELADQGSLDGRIELYQRLSELDVLEIGIKVASALDLALKHGFIHRDIKPGNILFNVDNEPKLADFGLARKADAEHNPEEGAWGTPYYVAPEKIKREPETFLSDMYSLGGTLYHALTGHVPFEAPTVEELIQAHVRVPLTPPNLVIPEISQATSDALACTLAKKPADRFQSYDELIMALTASQSMLWQRQYSHTDEGKAKGWWRR
ncbi:MAG TPA: serine/threonine-protein kinase [Verrucomicrobiae bacterium]|nr:serine/threonine-protein kinase [Verrucomicrobiae bacterium]